MAVTETPALVTELVRRLGFPDSGSLGRTDVLRALNEAYKLMTQPYSFTFLVVRSTLTLLSAGNTVAVPAGLDVGKIIVIEDPATNQALDFAAPDEFASAPAHTYGAWGTTRPSYVSIQGDTSNVLSFHFRPANTTGSDIIYTITYQTVVANLTDSAGVRPKLPETWEDTLLLDLAEEIMRRKHAKPLMGLPEKNRELLEAFYANYRANKEEAQTDRETVDRKMYDTQVRSGA